MENIINAPQKTSRNYQLDIIKAIAISFVLIGHLETIDISAPKLQAYNFNIILKQAIIFFYFQIIFLAVASFLLVSLFLYFQKLETTGKAYFFKRIPHLTSLFLFWVTLQYVMYYLTVIWKTGLPFKQQLAQLAGTFTPSIFILDGGPRLPIVGDSVFYYFSELIFLIILASVFFAIAKNERLGTILGAAWIIASLVYFEIACFQQTHIPYNRLHSFSLYVPLAFFFFKFRDTFSKPLLFFLITGYLAFSIQDYLLRSQEMNFNIYARPSIVFGAASLFYGIKNIKSRYETKITKFLSKYSLGIFATHKYIQYFFVVLLTPIFEAYNIGKKIPIWLFRVDVRAWVITAATLAVTFLIVYMLDKTPLNKYVK